MTHELFQGIADFSKQAEAHDLRVFEFNYSERIFGSWKLIVGSFQRRLQFVWEGKEFYLTCEVSSFDGIDDSPDWYLIPSDLSHSNATVSQILEHAWSVTSDQFAL